MYSDFFHAKLEFYQCKGVITMTRAIKGSSTEKLYQELGKEDLRSRLQFRKLCVSYIIIKIKPPLYLFTLIPSSSRLDTTKNSDNITLFKVRHNFFKKKKNFHQ